MKGSTAFPWLSWGSHLRRPKPSEVTRLTGNADAPTWGDQLERGRASPSCSSSAVAALASVRCRPEPPPPAPCAEPFPDS